MKNSELGHCHRRYTPFLRCSDIDRNANFIPPHLASGAAVGSDPVQNLTCIKAGRAGDV